MTIIHTEDIRPGSLTNSESHQTYCGLDTMVTLEVHEELSRLHNAPPEIYAFERALQAPYLEIMCRGFAVDGVGRSRAAGVLRERIQGLLRTLNELSIAAWGRPLNARSPAQLRDFFYGTMHLPEIWLSQKGQRKLSTSREALEKLEESHLYARPFIACILAIRDLGKQLDVFETEIDSDGRMRTSYNIAGTETGRPSSSSNAFGTGGNLQNIAPTLRYVFVADPGMKLAVIDLEQVEARDVGWFCGCLFSDWSYLDACELGDLHTNNARRIWPERKWTGDQAGDRKLADQNYYREFSYRDMAKRGSHLSNYMGTAWTASRALKVPLPMMEDFQARYVRGRSAGKLPEIAPAFPCIPRWWQWIAQELQLTHQLVTPFGRRRHFFGRLGDDTTLREAIAFLPQSTTADRMNLGLWRVWKNQPGVQLLAQTYDSITFQYKDLGHEYESEVLSTALQHIRVELQHPSGRRYVVPGEAKMGWNWGYASDRNSEGLAKWNPSVPDARVRRTGLQRLAGNTAK